MKISVMPILSILTGAEYVPIFNPNAQNISDRNARVPITAIYGHDGEAGAAGASAYDVWISNGHSGNQTDFLNSLVGATGQSAYQEWLANGNVGNESEFLTSLIGATGESAYQSWLDNGNTGTQTDFLNSLIGPQGVAGTAGSTIYQGTIAPNDSNGINGDYYINTTNGYLYKKVSGTWGAQILVMKGTAGSIWRIGSGAPSGSVGLVNDFYLNGTNGDVYGPKTTSWGSVTGNIRGPQGIQGVQGGTVITGSGAPSSGTGNNSDVYIDTTTGDLYGQKTAGAWGSSVATLATSWSALASKPTTVSGFGITDVYTNTQTDTAISTAIAAIPNPIEYIGTYNASTNTPTLANTDTGVGGHLYEVTVAGSYDFGAGSITFAVNDKVVNNGTVWERWESSDIQSASNTIKGNNTGSTAFTFDLTPTQVQTMLGVPATPYGSVIYASTVTLDGSQNTHSRIIATGDVILAPPSSPADGVQLNIWVTASGGARNLTLDAAIVVPTSSTFISPAIIASGKKSKVILEYDATINGGQWELVNYLDGF